MVEEEKKPDLISEVKTEIKTAVKYDKHLRIGLLLLTCLSTGFLGGWVGSANRFQSGYLGGKSNEAQQQVVLNESQLISDIAKSVGPSVVSVNVFSPVNDDSFFGYYEQESAGTGIIISSSGIVITNRHVVPRGATDISVTLSDGTTLEDVEVLGRTNDTDALDAAFLKINDTKGKQLTAAKLGDSSKVQVGDKVVAIGNALGQFQNTVTSGIISGYGRTVAAYDETGTEGETLQNLFQTDTAINHGNSGGPLVNIKGEVIGLNTAVAGEAENIGFAIPINDLTGLIKSVLEKGKLERPYLGVRYIALTDDIAFELGLNVKRGAYIVPAEPGSPSILPGSPADKAGLKPGDIITKINDTLIDEKNSLVSVLGRFGVGDQVTLTVSRNGQETTVNLTLEAAPNN